MTVSASVDPTAEAKHGGSDDLLQLVSFNIGTKSSVLISCKCRRSTECSRLRVSPMPRPMWTG